MSESASGEQEMSRRAVLATAVGIAGAGAAGHLTGRAAADDGSASGTIGTASNPAMRVYVDTYHFHERTSDPSSPSDGTIWYNSSA